MKSDVDLHDANTPPPPSRLRGLRANTLLMIGTMVALVLLLVAIQLRTVGSGAGAAQWPLLVAGGIILLLPYWLWIVAGGIGFQWLVRFIANRTLPDVPLVPRRVRASPWFGAGMIGVFVLGFFGAGTRVGPAAGVELCVESSPPHVDY